ncbi:MAG: SRPBCC family protein [Rhodocyclaceae bacterium]
MSATHDKPQFVYVTYIETTPQKLWNALIDPAVTKQYWYHHNVSDWKVGSEWRHQRCDDASTIDIVGKVLEVDEPRRLVVSWASPTGAHDPEQYSQVAYDIEPLEGVVKFTVSHTGLQPESAMLKGISFGWPVVLSGLKSLLENGKAIPLWWLEKKGQTEKCETAS